MRLGGVRSARRGRKELAAALWRARRVKFGFTLPGIATSAAVAGSDPGRDGSESGVRLGLTH